MKQAHDTCIEFARYPGRTAKPTPSDLVRRRTADDFPWEMAMTPRPLGLELGQGPDEHAGPSS